MKMRWNEHNPRYTVYFHNNFLLAEILRALPLPPNPALGFGADLACVFSAGRPGRGWFGVDLACALSAGKGQNHPLPTSPKSKNDLEEGQPGQLGRNGAPRSKKCLSLCNLRELCGEGFLKWSSSKPIFRSVTKTSSAHGEFYLTLTCCFCSVNTAGLQ